MRGTVLQALSVLVAAATLLFMGCDNQITAPNSEKVGTPSHAPASAGPAAPGGKCDVTVSQNESINDKVDNAAQSGDVVCVENGTYSEQVTINKDLTLKGLSNPTVKRPSSPDAFTIPESGPKWEPIIFAFGGDVDSKGNVSGSSTVDVTVKGFTIDGDGEQPNTKRGLALFYRNASGTVSGNTVENMAIGGKQTFGILAYGDSDVDITNNTINGYERGGIGANGDQGDRPDPEVLIRDNTVTGSGDGSTTGWGPNGIQVGFGASGKVFDNSVTKNRYANSFAAATSAGIIVFGSDDVHVRGNEVSNNDINLAAAVGENVRFVKNQTKDAIIGVYFAQANNGKLVNNTFTDPDGGPVGDTGVLNTGTNNKLINNTIKGFDTPILDLGTDSKVQANTQPAMP